MSTTTNPMVKYLTSLRTQEAGANPSYVFENRAVFLDQLRSAAPWFPSDDELHVITELDKLVELLAASDAWPSIVVLTGDAGDGKTQFCAKLAAALGHEGELEPKTEIAGWTIIKDASEVRQEQLVEVLKASEAEPGARALIAINEGRLRRLARGPLAHRTDLVERVIRPSLETWMSAEDADALDAAMQEHRWLVLNFRHRFHVRVATPALLEAWTRESLWEAGPACGSCPAQSTCPILANVRSLREPTAQRLLCDALASVHFAGQRLPLRRLQAVLALACTGGLGCEAVQTEEMTPLERLRYRFYDVLFARDPILSPVRVEPEQLCRALAPLDPGRVTVRDADRRVSLTVIDREPGGDAELPELERAALAEVRAVGRDPEEDAPTLSSKVARVTRHLRRWHAFKAGETGADWQRALRVLEAYANEGSDDQLLRHLVQGLNALHRQAEKKDRLTSRQLDPGGFRDPARLALELDLGVDLEAHLERGPVLPERSVAPWLESCPSDLYLVVHPEDRPSQAVRLHLDSRLVTALMSAREGFVQLGALGSYRRELARFFSRLVTLAAAQPPGPRVILRRGGERRALSVVGQGDEAKLAVEVDA